MRLPLFSTLMTLTRTCWPTCTTSLGLLTRRRDISETWSRPSTPAPRGLLQRGQVRRPENRFVKIGNVLGEDLEVLRDESVELARNDVAERTSLLPRDEA